MKFTGRKTPYTERGISRVPCARYGHASVHQWQICANDRRYLGACADCDLEVNQWALTFFRVPNGAEIYEDYKFKVNGIR